ncbi:MAG: 16S rRNA (cytidine(1402)-2'-O)-methyltransferase [Actinomycetota bacterium]|nr:16S rRNA (cytidine(1402)-2'-O)-methyltransferase [Actinomycetota bacterium]
MPGRLYLCGTPIGNLEDVTLRLLRVLGEVDLIAAEDTRRTRKLLTHHGIRGKLVAYHQANERRQTHYLLELLRKGSRIALVSDGGMPGVSDPGYRITKACISEGVPVEVIPGPSAILTALVASGLPTARFCFEGFLPRSPGDRARRLESIAADDRTLVVFEAPTRVRATLESMLAVFGDRPAALARELTKVHEEVMRGTISEVLSSLSEQPLGEIVIVVEGAGQHENELNSAIDFARALVATGSPKSKAAAEASARFDAPRRSVYEGLLDQPGEKGSQED